MKVPHWLVRMARLPLTSSSPSHVLHCTPCTALLIPICTASSRPPTVLLHFAGTREGQQLTQSSIRTFVREGTEVYMDKLEGTNSWADMLEAVSRPGNGAVADRLTRVFVREMVTSYFRRPREPETRWLPAPSHLHDHVPMIGSRCLSYCSAGFGRAGSSHKVACHSVLYDFVWLAICLGATTGPGKGVLSSLLGRR